MILNNLEDSINFATQFALSLKKHDIILVKGEVGVGKTFICRQIIRTLMNQPELIVNSPTFSLLQVYDNNEASIYHYDLYRLKTIYELMEIGLEDAMENGICLIEWPEILQNTIKPPYYIIELTPLSELTRKCELSYISL